MAPIAGFIWVVPGFGGNQLLAQDGAGNQQLLWLDVGSLLEGSALNSLVWGQPPPGMTVVPGALMDVLGFGYGPLLRAVGQFTAQSYLYVPWPYDWRDTASNLGPALAAAIIAAGTNLDHKIICHSYGACVVQMAMGALKAQGKDGIVSRVISIAGILSGSYSSCKTWREEEDSINQFALISNFGSRLLQPWTSSAIQVNYRTKLLTAFVSWPATYDTLPDPAGTDDPGDTFRQFAWNAQNWTACLVDPVGPLMANSRAGFQTLSKTPAYAIDPTKWVLIAGLDANTPTPWRMLPPGVQNPGVPASASAFALALVQNPDLQATLIRRQQLPGILYTDKGDNRATIASATRPGVATFYLPGAHAELQSHPALLAALPNLLGLAGAGPPPTAIPVPLGVAKGPVWPQGAIPGQL